MDEAKRQLETLEDEVHRKAVSAAKKRARRNAETPEQRERHKEKDRWRKAEKHQHEEECRSINCNWEINEEEFFAKRDAIENEEEKREFFKDIEHDPAKATILAQTHAAMQTRGSSAVLCGLILFIDCTFTAENDRLGCECIFFTLTIVPQALRNQPYAWRPLGMLPKFDSNSKKGQNATAHNSCLKEILSGLISIQQIGPITESVQTPPCFTGKREMGLSFEVPLCFAGGDVEGHDKICARYASHLTKYLNRECDCRMADACNGTKQYNRMSQSTITALIDVGDKAALQEMGYHELENAFRHVNFGANPHGINSCTPAEVLHFIQKGQIFVTLKEFFKTVLNKDNKPAEFVNKIATKVSSSLLHQSDRDYPQMKFPKAIYQDSQYRSAELPGVLLVLVLTLNCHPCWTKTPGSDINSPGNSPNVGIEVIED